MRWNTIAAVLASTPLAFSEDSQVPLSNHIPAQSKTPAYRDELLSLHKSLVSIHSISGTESDVGNFLFDYLTDNGYTASIQFVEPRENTPDNEERFNVVAWRGTEAPRPKVLVTSHIDVVPPHIDYEIDDGEVTKDTMIKGRGSVDAKGSVAAMVIAVEELLRNDKIDEADYMLLFVVGEEVSGDGMATFSKSFDDMDPKPEFDAVIFGEPTENKLACGHKGSVSCDIVAHGVGGHSGYPWLGKSANELMVRALGKILDADLGSSERFGETTVNIGRFEGGVAANVIPEYAHVKILARVAIGPEKEGGNIVEERIRYLLDKVDDEAFSVDCAHGYGFVDCDCEVDGFDDIVVNYGTDIPNLQGNHTRYLYGPGSILVAHGARENLTVGDLETAVEGYQRLILHALE